MKHLFLFVGLLLANRPASAQAPRRAARPDSLTASLASLSAAPDTVAALHRLFAARRRRLLYLASGTAVVGTATIVLIGSTAKPYKGGSSGYGSLSSGPLLDFTGFEQTSVGFIALLLVGIESLGYAKYSIKAEQQAIAAAQTHRLLPALKRQLKTTYFH